MKPYGLFADAHLHLWSAFAKPDGRGGNSRLHHLLDEIDRVCDETVAAGGELVVFAGDLFHVRGSIDPEVFNLTLERFKAIFKRHSGLTVLAIPGNHDLKGKETSELDNAFQALDTLPNFHVFTAAEEHIYQGRVLWLFPWVARPGDLMGALKTSTAGMEYDLARIDVICHVGINGVIPGMPDHGLNADDLAALGYGRIFAGHYHNHKIMAEERVVSIGALAHHTWSDVGAKAGFLLVWPDRVEYRASRAPSFVEVNAATDADDIPLIVPGNYVRVRDMKLADAEVLKLRREMLDLGALGVSIEVAREVVSARSSASVKATSLEESINSYIDEMAPERIKAVKALSEQILSKVRASVE